MFRSRPTPRLAALLAVVPALLAPHVLAQQPLPVALDVDYATFLYDDEASLLEVYLGVDVTTLDYTATAEGFVADLPLRLALRPASQAAPSGARTAAVFEREVPLRFVVADTAALRAGQSFFDRVRATVPPGEYELDVVAPADTARARPELRLALDVLVRDYSLDDQATVSDVALATAIRRSEDGDGPFFKNGLDVLPNPNPVFGVGAAEPQVFYYAEAYGVPETAGTPRYTLLAYVADEDAPRPLPGLQRRTERDARDPDVLVGSFDVGALPSGSYYLRLALLDENNEALAEQSKGFAVFNPAVAAPTAVGADDFETNLFRALGDEEVDEELRAVEAVATSTEVEQLRRLDAPDAKRAFLAAFWRARDTDSDPVQNEARRQFFERLRHAAERYGTPFAEAYETDRGRIVLRYGYPSEVDPRSYESEFVPHEVWRYDNIPGQGRAVFVFADREGAGLFELIHSTVTGEVSQPNWEQMLRR